MHLDILTFVFMLGITHVLQITILSYQYRMKPNYDGIGWWLLWSIAEVIGFSFLLVRNIPSIRVIAITSQNTFFILGVICLYIGILRFFGKKGGWGTVATIFIIYFALFSYFIFLNDNIINRGIVICTTLALFSFLTVHALLVHRPPPLTGAANFAAFFFLSHGCFFLFRAAMLFHAGMPHANPLVPTPLNVATFVDALISGIMWTFSLTILVSQRLTVEIQEAKNEMELIFNTTPDAAITSRFSDGLIVQVNEGFCVLSGFTREEAIGRTSHDLGLWPNPADRQHIVNELEQYGTLTNCEVQFQRKDGSVYDSLTSAKLINLHGSRHIISLTKDISNRKRMEEQIRYMANHDVLTGLPTMRLCIDRLAMAIAEATRNRTSVAVMFLDLDNFKSINDNFGHNTGDYILKEIAQRLLVCVRLTDTVARIGGDEFLIIAPGANARKSALRIAEKVLSHIAQPVTCSGKQVETGTSIGIALYPEDGTEIRQLINKADEAMYRVKKKGKNQFCFSSTPHPQDDHTPAETA